MLQKSACRAIPSTLDKSLFKLMVPPKHIVEYYNKIPNSIIGNFMFKRELNNEIVNHGNFKA